MTRTALPLVTLAALVAGLVGCGEEMGAFEAAAALEQSARSGEGIRATSEPIEVSTDFTIGGALEDAAEDLRAFWDSQAPCNEVERDGATTTIDWGSLSDGCVYDGHTYTGVTAITVEKSDADDIEVLHEWMGFHNEDVGVDGEALVTWALDAQTRRVQTTHTWSDDVESVDVVGDHEIAALGDAGYVLDGTRDWTTDKGDWHLDMIDIGFRLTDPVPESGSYVVTNPAGKTVEMAFSRVDDTTIEAVLTGVRGGELVYHIGRLGTFERVN